MTTTTYESHTSIGATTYRLRASTGPDLFLELSGTDPSGRTVASGDLHLPAASGAVVGKLLGQVLDALGKLGAPPTGARRPRPANANQPWTTGQDADLRTTWLSSPPTTPAVELIRTLAKQRERSPTSIRARLAKVGCDPDVVGRPLSPVGADLLGVQGRDQGEVRGSPDPVTEGQG
ncbi:hypothetical protein [Saccharothrix obliqua]|uniref:hypothetical protein n=1 Tax=Saccharothrix obliqua TaxID=2861747 RepID=UPI001C5E663B|nr:hypothetical protein [Saccharothrix obliqua]MBW4720702.1 hypothetical protein [Saccharothrix obliqua]